MNMSNTENHQDGSHTERPNRPKKSYLALDLRGKLILHTSLEGLVVILLSLAFAVLLATRPGLDLLGPVLTLLLAHVPLIAALLVAFVARAKSELRYGELVQGQAVVTDRDGTWFIHQAEKHYLTDWPIMTRRSSDA